MKIGILGGGQLARMLALAGYPLGLEFVCFDPNPECCAAELTEIIVGDYQNPKAISDFLERVDVITYENENIPLTTAEWIAKHKPFYPGVAILQSSQDRLLEKKLFNELEIKTTEFVIVDNKQNSFEAGEILSYPFILKTRREGYDGKGQIKINSQRDIEALNFESLPTGYIAEKYIPFEREVSIIASRNVTGETVFYDVCENIHQNGILIQTVNKEVDPLTKTAQLQINKVLQRFDYVGTLVIEFFVQQGQLIANEIAPRVHNSGHWTIEGANTSQFENHLRAILNYPLGNTTSRDCATMLNLLGNIPDKNTLLNIPFLHLHDYHKEARPGRKVGHVTLLGNRKEEIQTIKSILAGEKLFI